MERTFSDVSIKTDGALTQVMVDGVDMSRALSVTFNHIAGEVPTITLVFPVERSSVEGKAEVEKSSHIVEPDTAVRIIGDVRIDRWREVNLNGKDKNTTTGAGGCAAESHCESKD
jgi:hypothetical protein